MRASKPLQIYITNNLVMNSAQIEIQLIASLVAVACAIPGTFLVLRKMAMISDAISHSILP